MTPIIETPDAPGTAAQQREHLWALIKDIRFGMFTSRHGNGHLHSRPMTTQNRAIDEDASLWFFMSRNSEPVSDLLSNPEVNVVYADPAADRYVSVSGSAACSHNAAKKRQLWSAAAGAWFPGGADDPSLVLVQVSISHADYWDVKDSKLVQVLKLAKAAITGKPPADLGERAQIRMG